MADVAYHDHILPPGRIVQGSLTRVNTTDHQNRPLPPEKHNRYFAVAVDKNEASYALINAIITEAYQDYTQAPFVQQAIASIAQDLNYPNFSLKIEDGDTNPKLAANRELFGGKFLFKFSTNIKVDFVGKCCDWNNAPIQPDAIKCGDYIDLGFSMRINGNTDATAGLFFNVQAVRLLGYGEAINAGPTPAQIFGSLPAPQVAGASRVPVGNGQIPQAPGIAGMPQMPGGMPQMPQMPQMPGGNSFQPAMQMPGMPQPPLAGATPPAPVQMPGFAPGGMPGMGAAMPGTVPGGMAPQPSLTASPSSSGQPPAYPQFLAGPQQR